MDRKAVWTVWFLALLINLPAAAGASPSESTPVLEKTLSISSWHIHLSHHRFPASIDASATLKLTRLAPPGAIKDGLITLNGRFIHLKSFFASAESVLAVPVKLAEENSLIILLWGTPGAGLRLEIYTDAPPMAAPRIVGFEADPPILQRGHSSLLRWQTEQAERCEIQPGIGNVEPTGTLAVSPTETSHYTLTAWGQGGLATSSLTIVIENSGPVATPQNVTTSEDLPVLIVLTGQDIDGDALSFQIETAPANGTLSGDPPDLIYSPNPNFAGFDTFSFTVTDGRLASAAAPVTIAVQAANDPPIADAGPDRSVFVGEWVTLDGHLSEDMDGDPMTFAWALASKPVGSAAALTNPGSVSTSFQPDLAGRYRVQLIVHDGVAQSAPTFVEIAVSIRTAVVPEVAGLALAAARVLIADAKLTVGSISESHHESIAAGHVVSQAPAPGASVEEGSAVSLVVSLGPLQPLPVAAFQAQPSTIAKGSTAVLSWSTAYARKVFIDRGIGEVAASGSISVLPEHSSTYTLTAAGDHGTISATAAVQVTLNPAPQPEGSFGKLYEDLIPLDAAVEQHDPKRFALITGWVQNAQGLPLPAVAVTVHSHPQYGTASTDLDGRFSLPVEGGGILTVHYSKPGLIAAQRQVDVGWNDTAVVETVQMVAADPAATTIVFDGSAASVRVHRSSEINDSTGRRACTLVFSGDNRAYLADENGNKTLELKTLTTRATEYRTPESMPARLPAASAFTWCAEFSVDGVERVQFEKPVVVWVDNFLGFPVGEIVPVGYYDRDKARWLPMKNGRVVLLLDTDGDGRVDALDADGDGQPDDLDNNGSTRNEVAGLDDNQRYIAGATYWRAAVTHFSPIDLNWPFGLPPDATPPNPKGAAFADQQREAGKDPRQCLGSFLEEKSRIFHEDIPIPGTDLKLHYASSRTAGYKPGVITVPASGDTVPDGLIRIVVKAEVAGREYEVTLPPVPNQVARIEWDGRDYLDRPVSGTVMAHLRIGFVYYGVYYRASSVGEAFAQPGLRSLMIPTRQETVAWKSVDIPIVRGIGTLAEGWSLSAHHHVSPMDTSRIFKGDGTIGANNAAVIETVAGDGTWARVFGGMGGPAVKAQIGEPYGVAADAEGNLYIGSAVLIPYSHWQHRILKVDRKGIVTEEKNIVPASTSGFARDAQGNYYHSWANYHCVYKIDEQNAITTYGTCNPNYGGGFSGDGGPATAARFNTPTGIDVDSGGNVYVADKYNHRVRKIDTNGTITTFAGTGVAASSGDGGPAASAALYYPVSVAADGQGNTFIAEEYTRRVRKVDASGTITTVAGNGTSVFKGDGWRATETGFYDIRSIAVDRRGNLYIVSSPGNRVYKVDAGGIVSTVAGSGPIGYGQGAFEGEGGAATAARLDYPAAVAVSPSGDIYIADQYNERVRRVGPPSARLAEVMQASDVAFTEEDGTGYILSGAGQHKMTIDLSTGVILREFLYDSENRLTSILDAFDNRVVIERGSGGVPTAIVSPDGLRTGLSVNSANQLTAITYPDGRVTAFNYSPEGLELRKTEPAGNTFGHAYDSQGRLTDYTDDEGGHWLLANRLLENGDVRNETLTAEGGLTTHDDRYDSTGAHQSVVTDASGAQTVAVEAADGLAASSTLACGLNREYLYDIDSHFKFKFIKQFTEQSGPTLKRVTGFQRTYTDNDADHIPDSISSKVAVNGRTATLNHDIAGAKKTFTSAMGRSVVVEYDPNTLLTERLQAPGLLDATYVYDQRGRLVSATVGGRSSSFGYDGRGFLGSVTDPLGRQTFYEYDAAGRTSGITRPDGSQIHFEYDGNGNLTVLLNPVEVAHRFGHNRVNAASAYAAPISGTYQYRYDRDRRPTETLLPSGKAIRNLYDQGLLVRTETPEGDIYFNYLCGNKLGSVSRGGEAIAYTYEGILLSTEASSGSLNHAAAYSYDNNFELIQATYAGESTGFGYDNDGLLTQAGPFAIARDTGSGLPLQVSGAALQVNRAFNGYGEVQSQAVLVSGIEVSSYALLRDNGGNILRKNEAVGGAAAVYEHGYDAAGRLLTVHKDGVLVEMYQYDEAGARASEMNARRGIAGRTYTYSDEDHLLGAGEWTYQYDRDGFLTNKASTVHPTDATRYFYSSRGELLAVVLPEGKRVEYITDPLGRRIAKRVNGSLVEKYLWQGMTRLLAVYDGAGSLRMRFEYADDRMPVAMTAGGNRYYFGYDQVGSLIAVANGSGNVVKRISYDSFGNILEDTNPAFAVPFGFAGGLHDRDTGLVRFGFRDYDPEVGRWTAKDPIGFAGGDTDLYGYVLNNPPNYSDPSGLEMALSDSNEIHRILSLPDRSHFTRLSLLLASFLPIAPGGFGAGFGSGAIRGAATCKVETPYGIAKQSNNPAALSARSQVEGGALLYRIGTTGKSQAAEAQFWALEHPSSRGFAKRYGIPAENVNNANFIEAGTLRPGTPFITRPAPSIGANAGGGIEVVVPGGGINMNWFSMP